MVAAPVSLVELDACGGAAFTTAASSDSGAPPTMDSSLAFYCQTDGAVFDFCADFDEPLLGPWSTLSSPGQATAVEDSFASVSPPNSLLATSPALMVMGSDDAGSRPTATALLAKTGLPKGETHIQLDLRIDELSFPNGLDETASVSAFAFTEGTYSVVLAFRASAIDSVPFVPWILETNGALPVGATAFQGLLGDVGTWHHVAVDFNLASTIPVEGGAGVQGTITVDGQAPRIITLHPPALAINATRTLTLGVVATAAVGEAKLRFDNVTFAHAAATAP